MNSAANLVTTGLCGVFLLDEPVGLKWWIGALFILLGSTLMTLEKKDSVRRNPSRAARSKNKQQ